MTETLEVAPAPPGFRLVYKQYLDEVLWGRVTGCIVKEYGHSLELAERILNQTIAYLLLCGQCLDKAKESEGAEEGPYSPSELVDHGWHAFMHYQKELELFLLRHCGRMVYHSPQDDPREDYSARPRVNTAQALRDNGFVVDEALWPAPGGTCDGYSCGYSGCST